MRLDECRAVYARGGETRRGIAETAEDALRVVERDDHRDERVERDRAAQVKVKGLAEHVEGAAGLLVEGVAQL
eukprot:1577586-Prymnesium_polylepis.1